MSRPDADDLKYIKRIAKTGEVRAYKIYEDWREVGVVRSTPSNIKNDADNYVRSLHGGNTSGGYVFWSDQEAYLYKNYGKCSF